jgi:hypothetical protein
VSAATQLRLIILGASLGAIVGSLAMISRDDLRAAALAVTAGVALLALTFAASRLSPRVPRLAGTYASPIGRIVLTAAAVVVVAVAFNVLIDAGARGTSRPAGPTDNVKRSAAPAAATQSIAPPRSIAPSSADVVTPATPRPGAPAPAAPSAPVATPAAVTPSAAPAPAAPRSTPEPVGRTPSPTQTLAVPAPSPTAAPTSIIPTLPPLPSATISVPGVP